MGNCNDQNSAPPPCYLRRFNPRRAARGVEAAEVEIGGELLWMSKKDIANNRKLFGDLPGLVAAAEHYQTNQEYPARD